MKLTHIVLGALLTALALPAFGQGFRMSRTRPRFSLLLKPAVAKELKMTSAQQEKVRAVLKDVLVNGGKAMRLDMNTDVQKLDRDVEASLTPGQRARLYQLWLQRQDALALSDESVAKQLGLTPAQKRQVEQAYDDFEDKLQATARNATREGGMIRMDSSGIQKETNAALWKILTLQQAAKLRAMQGPKFKGEL